MDVARRKKQKKKEIVSLGKGLKLFEPLKA